MADETFKLSIDISDVSKGLQTVSSDLEGVQKQADGMSKNMTKGVQEVNLSLGEMKRELRELRNTSFMGKSADEIKQVRARMAELTDQIGDFQKQIREASNDRIPALINGLRGVVAGVQGVTATLSLFGVESEKLNKAMMSLINASMALNTVYDLYEKGTLQVAAASAKATLAAIAQTVSTKALALATNATTLATKALYTALAKNPMTALIVAATALAGAIYLVATREKEYNKEKEQQKEIDKSILNIRNETAKSMASEVSHLTLMFNKLKDTNTKQSERKKIIGELNNNYKDLIGYQIDEKAGIDDLTKSYDAIIEVLYKKYQTQAVEKELTELFATRIKHQRELSRLEAGGVDNIIKYNELIKLRGEAIEKGDAVASLSYQMQINDLTDMTNKTKWLYNIEEVHRTAIADTDKKIKGITSSFKDLLFEIKEDTKEKETNIKVTKTLGDANEEALLKYRLLMKKIGEEFVSLADLQKELKPISFAVEEEDTSTDSLQAMLSAAYALEKDHYAKLKFLRETNKISQEEYEDELLKMKLDSLDKYTSAATKALNVGVQAYQVYSDRLDKEDEARLKSISQTRDADLENLQEKYDKGLISKKSYEDAVVRVELNADKESKKIQNEAAKRQREIAIFQQAIATGVAIANGIKLVYSSSSTWYEAVIAAAGIAAEIIALMATADGYMSDAPQYAKGGQGKIEGKYHSEGGVPFFAGEAEKDERWAIFNRQATARNTALPALIDAINEHQIVIDKNFLTKINDKDGNNNVVVISNFKGGEHLKAIREIMEQRGGDVLMPDGRIKKGIIKRRLN